MKRVFTMIKKLIATAFFAAALAIAPVMAHVSAAEEPIKSEPHHHVVHHHVVVHHRHVVHHVVHHKTETPAK